MKKLNFYLPLFFLLLALSGVQLHAQVGVTVAGGSGQGTAANQLDQPEGIDVDATGNIYVSDFNNHRVQKWAPGAGLGIRIAGRPSPSEIPFVGPHDVFVDINGDVYVADVIAHAVVKYSPGDSIGVVVAGGNGSGEALNQVSTPYGIFLDAARNLYITDYDYSRVVKWAPNATSGEVVASVPRQSSPRDPPLERNLVDVSVDAAGNIYVANIRTSTIQKFAPGNSTDFTVVAGTTNVSGSGAGQLAIPRGIFIDSDGSVYVADGGNNRIQKWAPGATEGVTVAGGNGLGATQTQLNNPVSVVLDKAGNIYVCDKGNNRVQKYAADKGLAYKYYEGSWNSLPDFSTLTPLKSGSSYNTNISDRPAGRNDNFAFLWEGYIKIPTAGTYTFQTQSDDGSKLYFNSHYTSTAVPTVNNDGLHAPTAASGSVYIAEAGVYPIAITYFENDGGENMRLLWSGPGIQLQLLPDGAFTQAPPTTPPPVATANLTYKYYEGGFNMLPDFNTLTPVKTGTTSNFDLGIRRPGVNDSFAIVWDGFINIPTSGAYTFETVSDDGSKLYFNGALLVNNDGTHPPQSASGTVDITSAGRYPIKVEYMENYGAESFQAYWKGPGFPRELIPDPVFGNGTTPPIPATGLNYKYYLGFFNSLPNFDAIAPIRTGVTPNVDINIRNPGNDDQFAFMWQGYINIPSDGTYTFETVSDDGSKVYFNQLYSVNANSLVNNDGSHPAVSATGTVTVKAGSYPITITYFEQNGGQAMQLYWSGPGIARQLIPDAVFSPTPAQTSVKSGLNYKYFESDFSVLPNFNSLTPVKTGTSDNLDISVRTPGRNDQFAFLWQGYINIPSPGTYIFETVSDDGSKLYFNMLYNPFALATVNNDGEHPPVSVTGSVTIGTAGWYPITISFFERNSGEQMSAYWSGPGIPRQQIPDSAFAQVAPSSASSTSAETGITSTLTTPSLLNAKVYPNPFQESFNVTFYNSSSANKVQVGVYDLKGQLLYLKDAGSIGTGNVTLRVKPDANLLPGGIYVARLQINGVPSTIIKVVKVK